MGGTARVDEAAVGQPVDTDAVSRRNEAFWDELCGTWLARDLGLVGRDRATLEAFDAAYFSFYPYLTGYLDRFELAGRRVLEVGLGYGTLGQEIARRGAEYSGLDISVNPVGMMRHRLLMLGRPAEDRIIQGSALAMPFPDGSFDFVYSIGCLHHTGDLPRSISEVHRVLAPGGWAVVMVYHADSLRLKRVRVRAALGRIRGRPGPTPDDLARLYDSDTSGQVAPHTEFVSRRQVRDLFRDFSRVSVEARNFDDLAIRGHLLLRRRQVLGTALERRLGLDLYVVAQR
jgi:SAM-dependent methyltransferase